MDPPGVRQSSFFCWISRVRLILISHPYCIRALVHITYVCVYIFCLYVCTERVISEVRNKNAESREKPLEWSITADPGRIFLDTRYV